MYLLLFHDIKWPLHIFQLPTVDLPSYNVDEPADTQNSPLFCNIETGPQLISTISKNINVRHHE